MSRLKVSLSKIIQGFDSQSDYTEVYLNMKTGEVTYVESEYYSFFDSEDDISTYPEWQQKSIKKAAEVMHGREYEPFPSKYDINEYDMMKSFSYSMKNEVKERLLRAINGRGAFRRFKDEVFELGVRENWFDYREECLKKIAINWSNQLGFDIIE